MPPSFLRICLHNYLASFLPNYLHSLPGFLPNYLHSYLRSYLVSYLASFPPGYLHSFLHSSLPLLHSYLHGSLPLLHSYLSSYLLSYPHPPPKDMPSFNDNANSLSVCLFSSNNLTQCNEITNIGLEFPYDNQVNDRYLYIVNLGFATSFILVCPVTATGIGSCSDSGMTGCQHMLFTLR